MFDRPIEVLRYRDSRDEYGDRSKELVPVATLVAQRTESGGRSGETNVSDTWTLTGSEVSSVLDSCH